MTGTIQQEKIATREAYGRALVRLGELYPQLVVLDADLSASTKTAGFAQKYPGRFFDLGIAEQNLMGVAAGLALAGKIPCASTFAVFATGRPYDQIRASIAYPRLNVKIIATHAGLTVGEDGATHQALEDISLMRGLPNMTVIVPADGVETEKAVEASILHQGPVYIRLGRPAVPLIYDSGYDYQLGRATVLREGSAATLIATGVMVAEALRAHDQLAAEGISVDVVDLHTVKPIDTATIVKLAGKTGRVVTAEEHSIYGGLGSAVAEVLGEHCPARLIRIGVEDSFGESGRPEELMEAYGLTAQKIVDSVRRLLSGAAG